jgi:hypothetical protein
VRLKSTRLISRTRPFELAGLGISFGLFTSLALLGFWYELELAQAMFLLLFPLLLAGLLSLNSAYVITEQALHGAELCHYLKRLRFQTQLLGMISIFVAALWGMYHNFSVGIL